MASDPSSELMRLAIPTGSISRSISPENFDGTKGGGGAAVEGAAAAAASRLGRGWKVSPCINIAPGETAEIAAIAGSGVIQHLWMTTHRDSWRSLLLRIYWEGSPLPAVEVPLGDFFCNGWSRYSHVASQTIAANPHGGFNSYWSMPFKKSARITLENLAHETANVYYQVDYVLRSLPDEVMWFHTQWRRSPVVEAGIHPILDTVTGHGRFVGTYLAWQSNSPGWWGEGEIKFYLDGDDEFPTICGTGTEDYFGGAWNFDVPGSGYTEFTTPYLGLNQVLRPDGLYASQQRFGMYRWHIADELNFTEDLRVDIQALGIGPGQGNGLPHRYRQLRDDIASTAIFYLDQPETAPTERPSTPTLLDLETA